MPDEKPTLTPIERDNQVDGVIMLWLTQDDTHRPWSVDEIAREYGNHGNAVDALARLHGVGLIHRMGEFVWATRAAIHADEIRI
jgi:hypothetical protein